MANTNIYLKLNNIDGESTDKDHESWIELDSFAWGVQNPASFAVTKGGHTTQADISPINATKHLDNASVALFQFATTGKHIDSGVVEFLKLDGDDRVVYYKLDLTDILVSSFQQHANGEAIVGESFSLDFAQFQLTYMPQANTGSASGGNNFGFNIQTAEKT